MEIKKLIEIADVVDSLHQTPEYTDKGIPMVRVTDVKSGDLSLQDCLCVSEDVFDKFTAKHVPCEGDIVISRVGTYGNFSYVSSDEKFCLGQNTAIIIPHINSRYLYYYLLSPMMKVQIESRVVGSTQKTLSLKNIKDLDIPCFEKSKQDKIASILESIDKKIKNNNRINRNLLDQAIAIFVDKIWSQDKNGTIGDYCTMKSGFAFKSSWWTDKGIKVIKIGDIDQDNLNLNTCSCVDEDKLEKAGNFSVVAGDLVLAMTGATIGKFAMIPERKESVLVNQRVGKFFLGNEPLKRVPFIYCTLKMDEVYSEVIGRGQGSAQPNISAGDVMSIPCVIPSREEIKEFNVIAGPMFTSIVKNQNENEQLANLRDSLLPKLMSGELDASELDI